MPIPVSFTEKAITFEVSTLASGYLVNNNGSFNNFIEFPNELQLAPINNFNSITINKEQGVLISGNSLKVNTYHGGYTALKGSFLKSIKAIQPVSNFGINPFNDQIKKTTSIKMKNKNILFVISNNDSIKTYTYKNEKVVLDIHHTLASTCDRIEDIKRIYSKIVTL